jgi:hypothetical protein
VRATPTLHLTRLMHHYQILHAIPPTPMLQQVFLATFDQRLHTLPAAPSSAGEEAPAIDCVSMLRALHTDILRIPMTEGGHTLQPWESRRAHVYIFAVQPCCLFPATTTAICRNVVRCIIRTPRVGLLGQLLRLRLVGGLLCGHVRGSVRGRPAGPCCRQVRSRCMQSARQPECSLP